MSKTRAERAKSLEDWADRVDPAHLETADTEALRSLAELVERRRHVDAEITAAVRSARRARRSWSEIGAMLGVSKQAAQRKYARVVDRRQSP
jgi:CRISPR/Cas system-associated protein Csm6